MRKVSALLLAAATMVGFSTAPSIPGEGAPTNGNSQFIPQRQPAPDSWPKAPAKLNLAQAPQLVVQKSDSASYGPNVAFQTRRYHRQHWRRIAKGW